MVTGGRGDGGRGYSCSFLTTAVRRGLKVDKLDLCLNGLAGLFATIFAVKIQIRLLLAVMQFKACLCIMFLVLSKVQLQCNLAKSFIGKGAGKLDANCRPGLVLV